MPMSQHLAALSHLFGCSLGAFMSTRFTKKPKTLITNMIFPSIGRGLSAVP